MWNAQAASDLASTKHPGVCASAETWVCSASKSSPVTADTQTIEQLLAFPCRLAEITDPQLRTGRRKSNESVSTGVLLLPTLQWGSTAFCSSNYLALLHLGEASE